MATVELWPPYYHRFRLRGLTLDAGAAAERDSAEQRPRWVHFGSSISQGARGRVAEPDLRRAVALLHDHGDAHLTYVHGPEVFGLRCTRLLLEPEGLDRLHPSAEGHPVFASRFLTVLRRARCVP
ncbi:hypothetical protein ABZ370_13830 [Streptomyces sp. NPDC005962]|uniref:hypothetical protein n=1 Tax=Streptomyces sp. NPDC005962 TaxID=3154466 RepID=UPI0033F2CBA5